MHSFIHSFKIHLSAWFCRRDIWSEYYQIIIRIIFLESVVLNLWDFWPMDTFNEYHISVSESINGQYRIEMIRNTFCPGFIMMHIDRDMSP